MKTRIAFFGSLFLQAFSASAFVPDEIVKNDAYYDTNGYPVSEFPTLGLKIQDKFSHNKIALICTSENSNPCSRYRYVEIPSRAKSNMIALGKGSFQFKEVLIPRPVFKTFWATKGMAKIISDENLKRRSGDDIGNLVAHPHWDSYKGDYNGHDPKAGFVGFATGYGMILGIGEATWTTAAVLDFAHAVTVLPFEAIVFAARKTKVNANNIRIRKMHEYEYESKVKKVSEKTYQEIKKAIQDQT